MISHGTNDMFDEIFRANCLNFLLSNAVPGSVLIRSRIPFVDIYSAKTLFLYLLWGLAKTMRSVILKGYLLKLKDISFV